MALKLSVLALAWGLAIADALAPGQFTYRVPGVNQPVDLREVVRW